MSHISNWVVITGDSEGMARVNFILRHKFGAGWYLLQAPIEQGGTKMMEIDIYLAAFNYADIALVKSIIVDCLSDEEVPYQILVCDEHENLLTSIANTEEAVSD